MNYQAVLFDMDGTILNTIDDLTYALNYALDKTSHAHDYSSETVMLFFGSGVNTAIKRALYFEQGMSDEDLLLAGTDQEIRCPEVTDKEIRRVEAIFREYYVNHCHIHTVPYSGIIKFINYLRSNHIKTAVVSNKQNNAVELLVKEWFPDVFDFFTGQKEGIRRKPYPDMIEECLDYLDILKDKCIYIGDSEVDIETGIRSEMDYIAVSWGFRKRSLLEKLKAPIIVDSVDELYNFFDKS